MIPDTDIIIASPALPLDQNPAMVYIASLTTRAGQRSQAQALSVIAAIFGTDPQNMDWASLRYQHTAMIRSQLAQVYKPATTNKMLSALRQTLKQAWLLGQMSVDDYMRAANLEPVTGETVPAGRHLTTDELRALMQACHADTNTTAGIRDAAIIALMYIALLRREEVAKLSLSDYNPTTGELLISGKRNKERITYVVNGARDALHAWLAVRGDQPGALFVAVNKGGNITGYGHFLPGAVYEMVAKRGLQAGVENNSPHNFRRTGASDYLAADVDVLTVSKMGGWSNLKTLKRYDRRPEEAKRAAAEKIHIPT